MKKLLTFFTIVFIANFSAKADTLDSLLQQLRLVKNDSLRAPIYAGMAAEYLYYDTVSNPIKKMKYQNEAIINSYAALHLYSKYSDTAGLRVCFDNLAKVYHSQRKYSQAKWYVLQSNTLSRMKNDLPNVIASLLKLAAIKTDLKEFKMAEKDLNEASYLSSIAKSAPAQVAVQKNYAKLYTKMNKKGKARLSLKKSRSIADSMRINDAKTLAKMLGDSTKTKKKYYNTNNKRGNKATAGKKIAAI